jgi:alcohol dehydrogenase class IV
MQDLVADLPIEQCLGDVGIRRQDIDRLATDALKIQRLLANNPREVRHEDAVALYLAAL